MKKYMRDLLPLVAICLIAALLLASFNLLTKDPIAQNALLAAQATRARLLPVAVDFEPMDVEEGHSIDSAYTGVDEGGHEVGYVIQTTVMGYGGPVVVTVGLDMENTITGVDVGGEDFSETPGLGALAKEPAFTDQYIGKQIPLKLVKSGEAASADTVDAISGATRTSSAVNGGVNTAGKYISDLTGEASPNTATAQGFGGHVAVTIELDDSGAISSIVIGDEYFNETEGYGKKALEPEFHEQFIGKTPPLTLDDIDAISGATVTSTAVVTAINTAHGQLTGEIPVKAGAVEPDEDVFPAQLYTDGAWRATFQGFASPVAVKLVLDDSLTIQDIDIGNADFRETEGYGAQARKPEFQEQFIGKQLPLADGAVDAISGATVTSTAVFDAIDAIYQAASDDIPDDPQPVPENDVLPDEVAQEPVQVTSASASVEATTDGHAWTATAQGFAGPVAVTLTLDGLTITSIKIGDEQFNETPGLGQKALDYQFKLQFLGKTLPITAEDIDGISGATITTNAVLSAIDAIYQQQEPAEASAPATVTSNTAPVVGVTKADNGSYTATAQGFGGPVAVTLTLDGLTITSIKIGDEQFNETEGFGQKALDYRFKLQFLGKTLPLADGDVDSISGATVTSTAVLEAINAIYEAAK